MRNSSDVTIYKVIEYVVITLGKYMIQNEGNSDLVCIRILMNFTEEPIQWLPPWNLESIFYLRSSPICFIVHLEEVQTIVLVQKK